MTWLLSGEKIGEGGIQVGAAMIILLSALGGAFFATKIVKRLRLQVCMLTGACYYFVLLGMNALFFDGRYERMLLTAVFVLLGCGLVALLPMSGHKTAKRMKRAFR